MFFFSLIWFFSSFSSNFYRKRRWLLPLSAFIRWSKAKGFISCFSKDGLMVAVEMSLTGSKMNSAVTKGGSRT